MQILRKLPHRTMSSIERKRQRMFGTWNGKLSRKESMADAYDGRPVPLYQFISSKE